MPVKNDSNKLTKLIKGIIDIAVMFEMYTPKYNPCAFCVR